MGNEDFEDYMEYGELPDILLEEIEYLNTHLEEE